ncbi:MAG: Ig-like domain-containing protein, partial [Nitrososphaerales archaeon]
RLISAITLDGVPDATVNIVHEITYNNKRVLVSGKTDSEGFYSIPWVVDIEQVVPQTGGSFGTETTQGREKRFQVKVFAQFDGNEQYSRSVSNAQSFEVRLNQIKIFVERKPTYLAYESFTIRVRVTDVDNVLIDPDKITALFDNNPITLVREDTGIYSFVIASLAPGSHSLKVTAEKKGHVTDEQLVTIEGMKRRTALVINTDKMSYQQGETVTITVKVHDTSTTQIVSGKPIAASLTSPALKVTSLTLVGGVATYRLTTLDPVGTWSISASFAGDIAYFGSSASASFTVERAGVISPPPPPTVREKVSVGRINLVDQSGSRLRDVSVGQQVMIQTSMTSNLATSQEIAYISQVKDADGVTVALSWVVSTVSPGQSLELAISWLPNRSGDYTAEVFVWKSITDPEPLTSEVKRATIVVR